jgi:hypothetical protein
MAANRGLFVRSTGTAPTKVGTTPIESRLALAGLVAENSPGAPRSGVLAQTADNPALVTANASSMVYGIAPFEAVINRSAAEGVYILTVSGTTNVATDPSPGTGSRWDIIYIKQNDTDKGDANNLPVLDVAKGTAATSPTKPGIPTGAMALAEARIYAATTGTSGGTNTLTQLFNWTAARGAPIPVKSLADRQTITGPMVGQAVIRLDCEGFLQRYTNSGNTVSGWEYESWRPNQDAVTEFAGAGTGSRQIALINSAKPFARLLNVYGRATFHCPTLASGIQEVNVAVSAGQSTVANAQARSRMAWTAGYSNLNQSKSAHADRILILKDADAVVRLWLEVINGAASITPSFSGYYDLTFNYQPAPD